MLLRLLVFRPAATGFTAASLTLSAGKLSGIRSRSSPSRNATRVTAERRSLRRVAESASLACTALTTSCKVIAVVGSAPLIGVFLLGLALIGFHSFSGSPRPVSGGHGVTGADIREH